MFILYEKKEMLSNLFSNVSSFHGKHFLIHPGMPDTRLLSTSGEITDQAFSIRFSSLVASFSFCWTMAHEFSMGNRAGLFPGQVPLGQKVWILFEAIVVPWLSDVQGHHLAGK